MKTHLLSPLKWLSNEALIERTRFFARCERQATAQLIAHLVELDERRLFLPESCSSLFTFCTRILGLSEHAAYGRIEATRAARRFPAIIDRLADGSVHVTGVAVLAPHLTDANHAALLDAARFKSSTACVQTRRGSGRFRYSS